MPVSIARLRVTIYNCVILDTEVVRIRDEQAGCFVYIRFWERVLDFTCGLFCDSCLIICVGFRVDRNPSFFVQWNTMKFEYNFVIASSTRTIMEPLDAVLDVGGVYHPETDRYDHRQRGFDQNVGNGCVTKLSVELVYKHYGQEIVAKELGLSKEHPDVQRVFLAVYKSFMEAIDGVE